MSTYHIEQKIISLNKKYYVYDRDNKPYLEVVSNGTVSFIDDIGGSIFSVGHKIYIKNLDGSEFAIIKKRTGFLLERYEMICKGKRIGLINQEMTIFKSKISITTEKYNYIINGDVMARNFTISKDKSTVAKISKTAFSLRDKYKIDIFEEGNDELFIGVVIAIDNSIHN